LLFDIVGLLFRVIETRVQSVSKLSELDVDEKDVFKVQSSQSIKEISNGTID
jgi:hypothetical protein